MKAQININFAIALIIVAVILIAAFVLLRNVEGGVYNSIFSVMDIFK
jgi:hypothetical protein